jgi:redox-sensitive bicupin YhaK (pirin superfamily)
MIAIRPADARGRTEFGWLDSRHTFSFGDYYDPRHMGFRSLRVINDDRVEPAQGFGTHPHRDMEILTYVLEGALEHKDSMGTGSVIRPGEVQRMSAGRGVTHSEFNHSKKEGVHLLQIWVQPAERGITPEYEQKAVPEADRRGRFKVVWAPEGRDGALAIHSDAELHLGLFGPGEKATHALKPGRHAFVHVARGAAKVNGKELRAGDGAAISEEPQVEVVGVDGGDGPADVLLFDLA